MILALVLGLVAIAFTAYFMHLFFQLNRAERRLQETFHEVEAIMLQRYGRPRAPKEDVKKAEHPKTNLKA